MVCWKVNYLKCGLSNIRMGLPYRRSFEWRSLSTTRRLLDDERSHDYVTAYRQSIENPEKFWGELGKQLLHWDEPFERVLDNRRPPFTKWFVGGRLNACYNAIDRHINEGRGEKIAFIHDSPLTETTRTVTYKELHDQITVLAAGLRKLGVEKGDRVIIYMPLIPEAVMAMLAVVRLGAVHSVVFGGFAASELCTRIEHAQPKAVIAANCGVEPNKVVKYLDILHDAVRMSAWKPQHNVIFERTNVLSTPLTSKTDIAWEDVLRLGQGESTECVPVEANDPLYILYTSGTTDKPKGIQRPTGGHLVNLMYTMSTIYGLKRNEVWWAASDLGWVVGHSYICYAPLLYGATLVMYEGKPDRPNPGQYFRVISQHRVSSLFSAPTAFRAIRRLDPECEHGQSYDISSLKSIFIAGEPCDAETKNWIEKKFGVPCVNHWWQTETGSAITTSCLGFGQKRQPQYSTGQPFVGYDVRVLHPDGKEAKTNELGRIAIKLPLAPGTMSTLYKNDELFEKTYFQKFPGYYDTMDAGYRDDEGFVYVTARDDDVINVAGHRISTLSLEDAVLRHSDVADVAVFGVPEDTKGEIPLCLYVCKEGVTTPRDKLSTEIVEIIRRIVGPVAAFKLIAPVDALPRTRSGKTLRKAMAEFARDKQVILPGTVEDPSVFAGIRSSLQSLGYALTAPDPQLASRK